ncbi:MAG: hypothetical protein JW765_03000 [Deltaproteobacteria bacterium]|nr:hypothetical protein [Candidatus Zymogenaceae bacterium]
MARQDVFEVRVFRLSLLIFFIIGLVFLIVGLDALIFKTILNYPPHPGREVLYFFFKLFFVVIGGLIVWKEGIYLVRPPVMMRVSSGGISFGTGMGYEQRLFSWDYFEKAVYGIGYRMLSASPDAAVGLEVRFKKSPEIPAGLATSAGIYYADYVLWLDRRYMGTSIKKTIESIRRFAPAGAKIEEKG